MEDGNHEGIGRTTVQELVDPHLEPAAARKLCAEDLVFRKDEKEHAYRDA